MQVDAANRATDAELEMYHETVGREQPFLTAGTNALPGLLKMLGLDANGQGTPSSPILDMLGLGKGGTAGQIDPSKFYGSPGYQYQLQQGTNAVTNSAARNGGLGGNALRALQATGQGLANQNWNQYLTNASGAYQQLFSNTSGIVGAGQNAAANLGGIGTTVGQQIGSNLIGAGNAAAAGQIGGANALAGGISAAGTDLVSLLKNQQFQSMFGGGGASAAGGGVDLNALSSQAAANTAGGAPGL